MTSTMPAFATLQISTKNTFLTFDSPRPDFRRSRTSGSIYSLLRTLEVGSPSSVVYSPEPLSPATSDEIAKKNNKVLDSYVKSVAEECLQTTVMVRGIPKLYDQEMLLAEILDTGLPANFLYLPPGKTKSNRSYGFVNFETEEAAAAFLHSFEGHKWRFEKQSHAKLATVGFATLQGYDQNLEFYSKQEVAKGVANRTPWIKRSNKLYC